MKTVTKVSAQWCGPCKAFQPTWEKVKSENTSVEFVELDVDTDEGKEFAAKHGIRNIPAFVNQDGKKLIGKISENQLIEELINA